MPTRPSRWNVAVTPDKLAHGWKGPRGFTTRLARLEDLEAANSLLQAAGVAHLPPSMLAGVGTGETGAALRRQLAGEHNACALSVVEADTRGNFRSSYPGLMLVLVSVDAENAVVGVAWTGPPWRVIDAADEAGQGDQTLLDLTTVITKLAAVAVQPAVRGRGVGEELVKRCAQTHLSAGLRGIYGQFGTNSTLDRFYQRAGFIVLDSDERLPLPIDGEIEVAPEPDERLFAMWGSQVAGWAQRYGFPTVGG